MVSAGRRYLPFFGRLKNRQRISNGRDGFIAPPRLFSICASPATAERLGNLAEVGRIPGPINLPAWYPPGCSSGSPDKRFDLGSCASH